VDPSGHLLYCNPAAEADPRFQGAAWRGGPSCRSREDRPRVLGRDHGDRAAGRRAMRVEATVRRPIAPSRCVTTRRGTSSRRRARVTAIFTDISDSKRLEELHLRAERLGRWAGVGEPGSRVKNPLALIARGWNSWGARAREPPYEKFLTSSSCARPTGCRALLSEFSRFLPRARHGVPPLDLRTCGGRGDPPRARAPDCPGTRHRPGRRRDPHEGDEDLFTGWCRTWC